MAHNDAVPTTKLGAAAYLYEVKAWLECPAVDARPEGRPAAAFSQPRDYNDHKAAQLCEILGDFLLAQAQLDAWMADLGTTGCQSDTCIGETNAQVSSR
jgi:hypothetical protein